MNKIVSSIIILLCTISTAKAFCPEQHKENFPNKQTLVISKNVLPLDRSINPITDYVIDKFCKYGTYKIIFRHKNNIYIAYVTGEHSLTYEQKCDGGDSFGEIYNQKEEKIADIFESHIYCTYSQEILDKEKVFIKKQRKLRYKEE